jgi:hypothetical protein
VKAAKEQEIADLVRGCSSMQCVHPAGRAVPASCNCSACNLMHEEGLSNTFVWLGA